MQECVGVKIRKGFKAVADTKQQKIDAILGRALRDGDFRRKLVQNPRQVIADGALTQEEMELVSGGLTLGRTLMASSLLATRLVPGSVMFCTGRICNEGSASSVVDPGIEILKK
jgi:hypothetical protein